MKDKFHVGDVVELLPYNEVSDHGGLTAAQWNKAIEHNPLTIRISNGRQYFVKEVRWFFYADAFVSAVEWQAPVEDLL